MRTLGEQQSMRKIYETEIRRRWRKPKRLHFKMVIMKQELEQAAAEFAEHYADKREYEYPVEETDVAAGFKAGAEWMKNKLVKPKKRSIDTPILLKCRDCKHLKMGRMSLKNQWWDSLYCEMKPKTIAGETKYFYAEKPSTIACDKFEKTEEL